MKKLRMIDLCAGIGGMHLGFNDIAHCILASEIDANAIVTYHANFPDVNIIGDLTLRENQALIPKDFDILCAGFPCQPFSLAGKQKGFDDKRGEIIFSILEIARQYKPRVIFLENVKSLVNFDDGYSFFMIKTEIENLGYKVYYKVLNAKDYTSVAQNRERVYIVAFNKELVPKYGSFKFPSRTLKPCDELSSYLEQNVDPSYYYTESFKHYHTLLAEIKSTNTFYQWRRHYVRANKSGVCPTLTANMGTGGHNVPIIKDCRGIRKLTPRECLNLQGFPENYKLPQALSKAALYKQCGNSVVVPLIKNLSQQIETVL